MTSFNNDKNQLEDFLTKPLADKHYINAAGDTMIGDLIMNGNLNMNANITLNGNKITDLADCPNTSECDNYAVNKKYVDSKIADLDMVLNSSYFKVETGNQKDMLNMTLKQVKIKELRDHLDVNNNKIINLSSPETDTDAVNKLYLDQEIVKVTTALTEFEERISGDMTVVNRNMQQQSKFQPFCCNVPCGPNKTTKIRTAVGQYPIAAKANELTIIVGVNNRFLYLDVDDTVSTIQDKDITVLLEKNDFTTIPDVTTDKMLVLYFKVTNKSSTAVRVAITGTVYRSDRTINRGTQVFENNSWKTVSVGFRSNDEIEVDEPNVFYHSLLNKVERNQEETSEDREVTVETFRKLF